jgi:hypothetical protein
MHIQETVLLLKWFRVQTASSGIHLQFCGGGGGGGAANPPKLGGPPPPPPPPPPTLLQFLEEGKDGEREVEEQGLLASPLTSLPMWPCSITGLELLASSCAISLRWLKPNCAWLSAFGEYTWFFLVKQPLKHISACLIFTCFIDLWQLETECII